MGGEHRIDLALDQHAAQAFCRRRRQANAGWQLERDLLAAARLVDARLDPFDAGKLDAVLMGKEPARVHRRGLRPFRQPDPLAGEILRRPHRPVAPHIDRGMAEDA